MKKHRYRVLFKGYYFPFGVSFFAACLIMPLLAARIGMYERERITLAMMLVLGFGGVALLFFLLLGLFYIWFHRLTPEERTKIADAEPPVFRQASEHELEAVRRRMGDFTIIPLLLVMLVPAGIVGLVTAAGKSRLTWGEMLPVCGLLLGVFGTVLLCVWLVTRFWKHIDARAETAELRANHCFTRVSTRRYGGKSYRHYAVCYLPDGRYILQIDKPHTDTVKVIRYRKRFCILTPDCEENL
jgi:hypothetical protein